MPHENDLPFKMYMDFENQAKFHPKKYLAGLVKILKEKSVRIFEQTEVTEVKEKNEPLLKIGSHQVKAKNVLMATYAPIDRKLFLKKAFYTSYIYELKTPSGAWPEAIYEDTYDPYHYFRVDKMLKHDRVIIGGEDHRSDISVPEEKSYKALEKYIESMFKGTDYEIVGRWNGPIVEQADGLALMGRADSKNVFYATGFSGNGMTYSMIAAIMFRDFVLNKQNDWVELYDAARIPNFKAMLYKGRDYTRELFGGAAKNF